MKLSTITFLTTLSTITSFAPTIQLTPSTTSLSARKPFISGNWKLNPSTKEEALTLAKDIAAHHTQDSPNADMALFVPSVYLDATMDVVGDSLMIGAQCSSFHPKGAFTGAISTSMLHSLGVQWVLAGHSERRSIFHESNTHINAQCHAILNNDMNVMLCIGESLEEYEHSLANARCEIQLKTCLSNISKEDMAKVVIAYEPVWAIGTGKVATPETAQTVHRMCRSLLRDMYDEEVSESTRILYGGSVTPESVDQLMAMEDVDGVLVGGASLQADKFGRILNYQAKEGVKKDILKTKAWANYVYDS